MGMFDNVRCEMPLPGVGVTEEWFQTKDTPAQFLNAYVILADGRLVVDDPDIEMVEDYPDETRPLGGPMFRRVGGRCETGWTGIMRFYRLTEDNEWIEYRAAFNDGRLVGNIDRVNTEAP